MNDNNSLAPHCVLRFATLFSVTFKWPIRVKEQLAVLLFCLCFSLWGISVNEEQETQVQEFTVVFITTVFLSVLMEINKTD
jgi:hypothetical protein